ncbi:MAG TPA: hypothetical protein VFZ48_04030 [Candidatus Saccharimonadales bacterium]
MQNDQNGRPTIAGKSVTFWIVLGLFVVLLLTILSFFVQYWFVDIRYQAQDNLKIDQLKTQVVRGNGEEKDIFTAFGLAFVPRDSVQLATKGEGSETYTPLTNMPLLGVKEIVVRPQKQRAVEKIGANGLGCEITNVFGAFSYNCSNSQRIVRFNRPQKGPWEISIVNDTPVERYAPVRYKNGLLGFSYEDGRLLLEYSEPGVSLAKLATVPINTPEDADRDLMLITNKTDEKSPAFAIYNRKSGELFYYSDLKDDVEPKKFQRSVTADPVLDVSLCAMNEAQISCYFGPTTHPSDSPTETEHQKNKALPPTLETFSIQAAGEKPTTSVRLNTKGIDVLYMIKDSTLFGVSGEDLYRITQQGEILLTRADIGSVDGGESLSYVKDDKLYSYDTGTHETRLTFTSKHLRLGNVQSMGKTVLFNSFVSGATGTAAVPHTYEIKNAAAIFPRLEDTLPYADASLPISYMDYDNKRIYVKLIVGLISDQQTGRLSADPADLQRATYIVTERLRRDGFTKDKYDLIFDY